MSIISDRYDFFDISTTEFDGDHHLVTQDNWGVSYSLCDGEWTLKAYEVPITGGDVKYHAISGATAKNNYNLKKLAYDNGLLQYMIKKGA